ncbi:MAG: efflux RND transporter periplasmic adaptor subunit, partial [Bacteroidales bacterium]
MKYHKPALITQILIVLVAAGISGCSGRDSEESTPEEKSDSLIVLTKEQSENELIVVSDPVVHIFAEELQATGIIEANPAGKAIVTTHISGMLKDIRVAPGDYVKAGQFLCSIESMEAIILQQEYLESAGKHKVSSAEYQRAKELYAEKVISEKDFFTAGAEYKTQLARKEGLKARLMLLRIDPGLVEDGQISKEIIGIGRVCVVADRGMISGPTIAALEARGLEYVLGVRERTDKRVRETVLDDPEPFVPLLVRRQGGETQLFAKEVVVDAIRYIVCRNEAEAEKDRADRQAIVEGLERQLKKGD